MNCSSSSLDSIQVVAGCLNETSSDNQSKCLQASQISLAMPIRQNENNIGIEEQRELNSDMMTAPTSSAKSSPSLSSPFNSSATSSKSSSMSSLSQSSTSQKNQANLVSNEQASQMVIAPPSNTTRQKNVMACEMCNNYEVQLQDIQYREAVLNLKVNQHEKMIKQLREELKKEQVFRNEVEDKYLEESKKFETNMRKVQQQSEGNVSQVERLTSKLDQTEKRANDLVSDLINQIEDLKKQILRLTSDNEKLLMKHLEKSQTMLSQDICLPQDVEQLQFQCLTLRENLIQALSSKEHLEDTLKSDNMLLKEQLRTERKTFKGVEDSLTNENEILKTQIDSMQAELTEAKSKVREIDLLRNQYQYLQLQSTKRIQELEKQLHDLKNVKTKSDVDLVALKNKVQSLQTDLDTSEQVQRDFVKLSQSLQVQLEKIRQADNEVRWQHEDDVTECNGCKKQLLIKKDKVNCSHCGKIFCLECCSKTIHGGPRKRLFKVCQVCHTLLDNQTACWFVNEAPQSPT